MSTTSDDYVLMQTHPDHNHDDIEMQNSNIKARAHKINCKFILFFIIGYLSPAGIYALGIKYHLSVIVLSAAAILLLVGMMAIKYRDSGGENKSNKSHALWLNLIITLVVVICGLIHSYYVQDPYTFYICVCGYIVGFLLGLYGVCHRKSVHRFKSLDRFQSV